MLKEGLFHSSLMILLMIVTMCISLFSCQKDKSLLNDFGSYYLEKEKEFLIHSLSSVDLIDYYPEDRLYLGSTITHSGKEICLVDESGRIILSRNMKGEGPEQYISNLSCLAFSEKGNIWAMTNRHILQYDQNLNILVKFTYESSLMFNIYTPAIKFSYIHKDTNQFEITFPTNPSGSSRHQVGKSQYYNTGKLLELYDQKKGYSNEIAPVSNRRITEDFLSITKSFYAPIYFTDAKSAKLFLTGTFDNKITIYDLKSNTVVGNLDIYHGDPNAILPPTLISPQKLPSTSENWLLTPKNHKLYKLDNGLIALEYIVGVSINPNPKNVVAEILQDFFHSKLILFDQNKQISHDLTIPENGVIMTSLPGNRLLFKEVNPEREEDFSRYIIFKIMTE
ncbi:hypothetical protein ACFSKL_15670 [Belliella marina]|uniref:DUF4221 domain-containing protein n=1 Tax=Belliella marina TaxID=1644146 RepID=A0ABW4VNC2_9BACT